MRLGGWQRLYVLVSTLYLVVVVIFAVFNIPRVETTQHRMEFYERMSKESACILDDAAHGGTDIVRVEMPNGHVIAFAASTPHEQMEQISRHYYKIVKKYVDRERWLFFGKAFFVWWLLPMIVLYAIGVAVGWVYKGFGTS